MGRVRRKSKDLEDTINAVAAAAAVPEPETAEPEHLKRMDDYLERPTTPPRACMERLSSVEVSVMYSEHKTASSQWRVDGSSWPVRAGRY